MFVATSNIFWYCLFSHRKLFGVLFIYLINCVTCFRLLPLGAEDFENLQELDVQNFEQQLVGEQGK
jgi:hypothetical protein